MDFDYFRNSWTLVGLKDYARGTRVTPDCELLLDGGVKLELRYGRRLIPLSYRHTKTLLEGWLPVVLVVATDGAVRYEVTIWATPLPGVPDWRGAFEGPAGGENFLNWIRVRAAGARSAGRPQEARFAARCPGRFDGETAMLEHSLAPGESTEAVLRLPFSAVDALPGEGAEPEVWLQRTVDFWRSLLGRGALFEVPERKVLDAFRASLVYQLITSDQGSVHGGEGFYDELYLRDGAYQILQLEEAGFLDLARRALEDYLGAQRPDGRFETQEGQLDANGQALWALWKFHQLSGDGEWLARVYPRMARACEWIAAARREAPAASPFAGLLPAAPADGEYLWDGRHHIAGYDFWNLRGLLCTAGAARRLGKEGDAARFEREAGEYRAAIDAAWRRTGLAHFPPSWEKDGTHWGNTEVLWPTPLFPASDPRVTALLAEVRERFGGGFREGTIRWCPGTPREAIHPYLSAYTTMGSLARGESEQVVEELYWYLLHSTAAHAFPEGVYPRRRIAWGDTVPHATGAANYAFLLRHLLVHEEEDVLHLLPAVPDGWLAAGKEIRLERAPTHFGPVSFHLRGLGHAVEVRYEPPRREPPRRSVLHLPEGQAPVSIPPGLEVESRRPQGRPWSFDFVVGLYARVRPEPVAGLVDLPLEEPPEPERCHFVDLAPLANTDPRRAPFGVPDPGEYLFTGLASGVQSAAGVPFRVIDPPASGGRSLVVLRGGGGEGAAARFPAEVEIPVGIQGRRVFFLGNVLGWPAGDRGAVAEYVIRYAGGEEDRIPLVPARTADDWAQPPEADQVVAGLQGRPWHLNVLGAPLRPARVETIVFRDLGTVSAPLLAAVTIER